MTAMGTAAPTPTWITPQLRPTSPVVADRNSIRPLRGALAQMVGLPATRPVRPPVSTVAAVRPLPALPRLVLHGRQVRAYRPARNVSCPTSACITAPARR